MKSLTKLALVAVAALSLTLSGTVANATEGKAHKCGVVHTPKKPLGKKALAKKAAQAQLPCKVVKPKKA